MKRLFFIIFICQIFTSCLVLDSLYDKKIAALKEYKNDENITALPVVLYEEKSEVNNGYAYSGVIYGYLELIPSASAEALYVIYRGKDYGQDYSYTEEQVLDLSKKITLESCLFYIGQGGNIDKLYLISTGSRSKNDYQRYKDYRSWYGIDVVEEDYVCWGETIITNLSEDHIELWLPRNWFETFAYTKFD